MARESKGERKINQGQEPHNVQGPITLLPIDLIGPIDDRIGRWVWSIAI